MEKEKVKQNEMTEELVSTEGEKSLKNILL